MANISPAQAYEMMGKPKPAHIESLALDAQKAYMAASDPLAKQSAFELVTRYFDILEWIDGAEIITEAKAVMGQVQKAIHELKTMLCDNERILISGTKQILYQIIDSYGNAMQEMNDTSSLAIARQHKITPELLEGIAKNDIKALAQMREIANSVVSHSNRMKKLQAFALEVSRVILPTVNLAIVKDNAQMKVEGKTVSTEYKNRLKMLKEGKLTITDNKGQLLINGKAM